MKSKEFKVGLFIAVAIAMLYIGFNFLKGIDFFTNTRKYYAVYDNIDQLNVSNPVLVNGYAVGRVSRIRIMQSRNNHVLVEMDIDANIILRDSTKAILNSEVLGAKSVLLKLSHSKKILKPGDTLIAEVAKGMFDVLSETATPVATDLQTTLRKFSVIVDKLNRNSDQLQIILAKFTATPDLLNLTLRSTDNHINEMSIIFKGVADNLNGNLNELKPTLANFKVISDSLKDLRLKKTMDELFHTMSNLNMTLEKLKKRDNTIGKLLNEDSTYVNLNHLMSSLDILAKDFETNPKKFMAPLGQSKRKIDKEKRRDEAKRKKEASKK